MICDEKISPILLSIGEIENLLHSETAVIKNRKKLTIGDRFWVKEIWQTIQLFIDWETGYCDDLREVSPDIYFAHRTEYNNFDFGCSRFSIAYKAGDHWEDHRDDRGFSWRSALSMPHWASRMEIEVLSIDDDKATVKATKKNEN